jgi:choline dehydrogenase-like flavoprotein
MYDYVIVGPGRVGARLAARLSVTRDAEIGGKL